MNLNIKDTDKVLDVGGGMRPLKRANSVIDIIEWVDRGKYGYVDEGEERFFANSWHTADICSMPWPFKDKEFDFVFCSHTLEDIRDPISVCKEMSRVGKSGYIETPSISCELSFVENNCSYRGYHHHRWLVENINNELIFTHKNNLMIGEFKNEVCLCNNKIMPFSWSNEITAKENILLDMDSTHNFLKTKFQPINFVVSRCNDLK